MIGLLSKRRTSENKGSNVLFGSVVRLLDFHIRSSKIIVQEVSIDDRL